MAEFIRRKILFDYFWLTEHLQRKCDKTNTLAVSVMGTQKSGARLLTGQNCHILILHCFGYLESFQACLGFIFLISYYISVSFNISVGVSVVSESKHCINNSIKQKVEFHPGI